jgi:tRNA-Thr(GGU) m(6)t(6)A37 methyltransferase TsaA
LIPEKRIIVKPIGVVETEAREDEVKDRNRLSKIAVDQTLKAAIEGIEGFSHVYVLFWLDRVPSEERKTTKVHPRGRQDLPLVGVFGERTNLRPNPIGLTLVELVEVKENVLTVRGLDAFDGTPVLDLKPYDTWDMAKNPIMPEWWHKLEKERVDNLIGENQGKS